MLVGYVINLKHRTDRLKSFFRHWENILDKIIVIEGVYNSKKFAGCGLAHSKAIKTGLSSGENVVLVFEDDSVPTKNCTKENLVSVIKESELLWKKFHCVQLYHVCDSNFFDLFDYKRNAAFTSFSESKNFLKIVPNGLIVNSNMMIYSKTCLDWLNDYEFHLLNDKSCVPNDRLYTKNNWDFQHYTPTVGLISTTNFCSVDFSFGSDNGSNVKILKRDYLKSKENFLELLKFKMFEKLEDISNFNLNFKCVKQIN